MYVSNLSFHTTDENLRELFGKFGAVSSAKVITDRESGRSRGFGFVEMVNDDEAKEAIRCMNGASYYGRRITVNIAEDKGPGFNAGGGKGAFRRN